MFSRRRNVVAACALRNAAPLLLAEMRALRAENDRIRSLGNRWRHACLAACRRGTDWMKECYAARRRADQLETENGRLRAELAARAARVPSWLPEFVRRLRTQDSQCTANPVFTVQQRHRISGIDTQWTEDVMWIQDGEELSAELSAEMEASFQETGIEPDECTRTGYVDEWEHVATFFTEKAAKDYIERNRHRMRDPRVYVDSAYRNEEWQQVVAFLMSCVERAKT